MADYQKQDKRHNKKYKYPMQPMLIPVGAQPVVYPPPVMGQPQPVYAIPPQPYAIQPQPVPMPMVQPINRVPGTGNQVVAVPIGPPVTVAQPIAQPVLMPAQPMVTPTPPPLTPMVQPKLVAPAQKPTIIIKKYYQKEDDCCCNIF